jgi:hypothetical protein
MKKCPKSLKPGDTIGIVSTSSPTTKEAVRKMSARFEALGYRVKTGEHVFDSFGFMAGLPETRAFDFNKMTRGITMELLQEVARERGGECISKKFTGSKDLLKWRCSKGHIWKASTTSIYYNGTWCKKCSYDSKKLTIEKMRQVANERGGKLWVFFLDLLALILRSFLYTKGDC